VAGPGVDGELSEQQVIERCHALHSEDLPSLSADEVEPFTALFEWHPSEATGLLTAAARGHRGMVQIRDAGLSVTLTDATAHLFVVPAGALVGANIFAASLIRTTSLNEIEDIVLAVRESTELDYERRKAGRVKPPASVPDRRTMIGRITEVSEEAGRRADYLTVRRLAQLTDFPLYQFDRLTRLLGALAPSRLSVPLWRLR
jgi:hypothetical protein